MDLTTVITNSFREMEEERREGETLRRREKKRKKKRKSKDYRKESVEGGKNARKGGVQDKGGED